MSSCHIAPLKIITGSGSSWSWATLHQLLSTAADYGGHDVVISNSEDSSSGFFLDDVVLFFGQTKSDGIVVGYVVGQ